MNEILEKFKKFVKLKELHITCYYKIKAFMRYCENNNIDFINITYEDYMDYILELKDRGLQNGTISNDMRAIRIFYKFLIENKMCREDILETIYRIKLLYIPFKVKSYIREEDLNDIIEMGMTFCYFIDPLKLKAILLFLFYTGLRRQEFLNLKRKDIDLDKLTVYVRGKTKNRMEREVPIPKRIANVVKQYFITYPEETNAFNYSNTQLTHLIKDLKCFAPKNINLTVHTLRHCVSEDSEILTEEGWKTYDKLRIEENIYTVNLNNLKTELKPIQHIYIYKYKGNLINVKNKQIDNLITKEHKNPLNICKKIKGKDIWLGWNLYSLSELNNIKSKRQVKFLLSGKFNGKFSIGIEKAGILGCILTDGNISKKQGIYQDITIHQSLSANKEKCDYIESLLKKANLKFSKNIQKPRINKFNGELFQMVVFRILKESQNWIFNWITENNKPKYKLLQLKYEELLSLYKSLMMCDGDLYNEFCDQDKEIIDFFRTLCHIIGYKTNLTYKNKWRTYISKKQTYTMHDTKVDKVYYNGIVWCPETENGTFYIKRKEKIFITGNSYGRMLARKDVNIRVAQKLLGHKNVHSTLVYFDVEIEDAKKTYWEKIK